MKSYNIYHDGESLPMATFYNKERADQKFEKICNDPKKYGITWEVYMFAFPSGEMIKRKVVATLEERFKELKRLEKLYQ